MAPKNKIWYLVFRFGGMLSKIGGNISRMASPKMFQRSE